MIRNNPANIRYNSRNKWRGQLNPIKGFCTFSTLEFGVRALVILLYRYVKFYELKTIDAVISRYAPATENDTKGYINFVCKSLGLNSMDDITTKIEDKDFLFSFCAAICRMESSYILTRDVFEDAISFINNITFEK